MRMKYAQSALASASSLLALSIALPVSAQAADPANPENLEEIVVTGLIGSLQRNLDMKRSGTRGEPTGITVRGFGGDFNETLYDGRRISTATGGRSVDFSTVGADFVGALTVMKTPDVTLSSSSIGATVNVAYPKPLDRPGMHFTASAAGSEQEEAGSIQPSAGRG